VIVTAELDSISQENEFMKKKIRVFFPYNPDYNVRIKRIAGAKFTGPSKPQGPSWTVPLDVDACHMLRKEFGEDLRIERGLSQWYVKETKETRVLTTLAAATSAELTTLPIVLPELFDFVKTRPYQLADIAFMAQNPSPSNFNQPGLGKTVEVIGAVFEAKMDEGPQLVMAPVSSLDVVWQYELERWQPYPVLVATQDPRQRIQLLEEAEAMYEEGQAFWLVVNPAMVRYKILRPTKRNGLEHPIAVPNYPELFAIQWKHKIVDEFHKCGLGNTATQTHQAMVDLKAEKAIAISGTPIGGKAIKLYGVLHFENPTEFSSKWRFADQWLTVTDRMGRDGTQYGKAIENIRPEREEAFAQMLARYAIRRTKAEVAPELPPKQFVNVWANLTDLPEQFRQYKEFEKLAAVKIADEEISATSILAEYTRLKQFADAVQDVTRRTINHIGQDPEDVMVLKPVLGQSVKLPHVERLLNELGIDPEEPAGDEQVVICSQFSSVVDMVTNYLLQKKYPAARFTGATKPEQRAELVRAFQNPNDPLRVLVMTTTAGGVSITLDNANTMIVIDETWVPDDQEQVADRLHRASRIHQVTVYTIRTRGTIEEYVMETNVDKQHINDLVLDVRRRLLDEVAV